MSLSEHANKTIEHLQSRIKELEEEIDDFPKRCKSDYDYYDKAMKFLEEENQKLKAELDEALHIITRSLESHEMFVPENKCVDDCLGCKRIKFVSRHAQQGEEKK